MKTKGKMYFSAFWVLLGIALLALGVAEVVDSFWSGMGGGMIGVGVLQVIRFRRYENDPEYRKKRQIQEGDERNLFIQGKAWQWAATLFIVTAGIGVVVFRLIGQDLLSLVASCAVCYLVVLYWVSWLILQKKY